MLKHFDFKGLTELDAGRIATAFDQAMVRMYEDLADRATVNKSRTLTVTVSLTPIAGERGELDDVDVDIQLTEKVPARQTKVYRMSAEHGALFFNEESPDNPDQRTLDELAPGAAPPLRRVGG